VTEPLRGWANAIATAFRRLGRWPPRGSIRFGSLRRLSPISRTFGLDRGQCIDRFYIERFLASHARDIRGAVLEIGDDGYARRFGRDQLVTCDVLHVEAGHPGATIVADLAHAEGMASTVFDCIIVTQTLQFIFGVQAAVETVHRLLKPGGVVLATVPGISQISRYDMDRWGEYWRFTTLSMRRLFEAVFPPASVSVEAHGNVLTSVAFLHGLAADELRRDELDYRDADYELLITIRAIK
jgi:SAM-dependent methyltransferase